MKLVVTAISFFIAGLLSSNSARADFGPSFLRGPRLHIDVRFENLDRYSEFDFYLKDNVHSQIQRLGGSGNAISTHRGVYRLEGVYVFAVPRGQKVPSWHELVVRPNWLAEKLPGSIQSAPLNGPDGQLSERHNKWSLTYRVEVVGDTLRVELIDYTAPPFTFPTCIASIAISATLAVIVIVMARRYRSRPIRSAGEEE